MITPHTTPQDYDTDTVKLEKVIPSQTKPTDSTEVDATSLRKNLANKELNSTLVI